MAQLMIPVHQNELHHTTRYCSPRSHLRQADKILILILILITKTIFKKTDTSGCSPQKIALGFRSSTHLQRHTCPKL